MENANDRDPEACTVSQRATRKGEREELHPAVLLAPNIVPQRSRQKSRNKNARQYDVAAARSLSVPTSKEPRLAWLENAADCQLEKPRALGFSISHRPKGAGINGPWGVHAPRASFFRRLAFSTRGRTPGDGDREGARSGRKDRRWWLGRERASETRGKEFKRAGPMVSGRLINYA